MSTDNASFRRHLSSNIDELANLICSLRSNSLNQAVVIDKLNREVEELKDGKANRDKLITKVLSENRDLRSQCNSLSSRNAELLSQSDRANKPRVKADLANIRNDGYRRELLSLTSQQPPAFQPISAEPSQTSELIDVSNQINSLFNFTAKLITLHGLPAVCECVESSTNELLCCRSSQLWFTSSDEMWSFRTPQERIGLPVAFAGVMKSGSIHRTDSSMVIPIAINSIVIAILEISSRDRFSDKDETIATAWAAAFSGKIQTEQQREREIAKISRADKFTDFAASLIPIRSFRQLCLVAEKLIAALMVSNECLVFAVHGDTISTSKGFKALAARAGLAGACAILNEVIFLPYGGGADARYDGNIDVTQAAVPLLIFPVLVLHRVQLVVQVTRHRAVFQEVVSTEDSDIVRELSTLLAVCCNSLSTSESPETFVMSDFASQGSPARDFTRGTLREIASRESQTVICIPEEADLLTSYGSLMGLTN